MNRFHDMALSGLFILAFAAVSFWFWYELGGAL